MTQSAGENRQIKKTAQKNSMASINNIPDLLKQTGRFCTHKKKIPYNPSTGSKAQSNNPGTFTDFNKAVSVAQSEQYDGVGIGIFDNVCAIDIDDCITDGEPSEVAQDIIKTMDSYTEISPSGNGIRILFTATAFNYNKDMYYINNRGLRLEVYVAGATNKYVTVTGNEIQSGAFGDRAKELQIVLDKYMKRKQSKGETKPIYNQPASCLSDNELLEKARNAKNGDKFNNLYSGNTIDYESQSEADLALCNLLAFWCGCNTIWMDKLFRGSGLYREKWDRKQSGTTYGHIVIEKAVHNCTEVYSADSDKKRGTAMSLTGLEPTDLTDLGQSRVLAQEYQDLLQYSRATKWLIYNGKVWSESEIKAQGLAQALTDRQLREAIKKLTQAQEKMQLAVSSGDDSKVELAKVEMDKAKKYREYVLTRRNSGKLSASLKESQPALEIEVEKLDSDPFKLNTPSGTVDLRTGEVQPHVSHDYITKITAVSASDEGMDIFTKFLDVITCRDKELAAYMQITSGMEVVGRVFSEVLEIAHGGGSNGKSTYYNVKSQILGDYAGSLSAETLTVNCRKNKSPEYAELRGKRLVIAAELEEGVRLDTAIVKKLCSTDPIYAEKKYKDPFKFTPSHTVVLYTNHLPKVGTSDDGTWRRLVVIPFKAVIDGDSDIKNYADYLYQHAGGAMLKWIIEGAVKFINSGYKLHPPKCVEQAITNYREGNNWLGSYIYEHCETGETYSEKSGKLYQDYRNYCKQTGEYIRSSADFKAALEGAGYTWRRTNKGGMYYGLRLQSDFASTATYGQTRVTEDYTGIPDFLLNNVEF